MTEQFSFISARWPKAKAPKRVETLRLLESVIPWDELEALLRPHYHSDARRTGRKGYSLKMLLRCWVVACVWRLSDDALESFILDSLAVATFIGTDPWAPRPPSASSFRGFRHLVRNALGNSELRLQIDLAMIDAGIQWRQGAIVEPVFRRWNSEGKGARYAPSVHRLASDIGE